MFSLLKQYRYSLTPLETLARCSAAGLDVRKIPAGFNAPLEFLTGLITSSPVELIQQVSFDQLLYRI